MAEVERLNVEHVCLCVTTYFKVDFSFHRLDHHSFLGYFLTIFYQWEIPVWMFIPWPLTSSFKIEADDFMKSIQIYISGVWYKHVCHLLVLFSQW